MHDIKWICENPEAFDRALARRGLDGASARLVAIDGRRRAAIVALEQAQASRNAVSKQIGEAKKAKDEAKAQALMAAQVVAITGKSYRVKEAPAVTQENKKSRKTSEPATAGAAS